MAVTQYNDVEREFPYTERADDEESMDEDHENVSEDGSTGSDSEEDSSPPVKLIKDFVRDPREQDVTLHVKVMKVGGVEEKSNKKQFMATVADATSAVDICVREEKLFDKFEPEECIILRNVTWTGRVLLTKFSSTATFAAEIRVPENIIADAFGEGEPVPISEVQELPDLTRISLTGKIVKQSPLIKRKCFDKVLSYRQVKLKNDTGSVYVDVWGDITEQMQLGMVCTINSCRKRQPLKPLDPFVTTTPKSTVMGLPSSELRHIREDRYQRGTLVGIDVTPYMSCPNPKCFHFQLTDGLCECCQRQIPDKDQMSYGVATIEIQPQKGNIHSLTAYWPELSQLFRLFKKNTPPGRNKKKIVKSFKDLMNKTVKYQACGIVSKFKL